MPKVLPGYSDGEMPGRSKADGGAEGNEDEDEVRRVEKEVTKAIWAVDPVNSNMSGVLAEEPFQHAGQRWECSQT